MIVDEEKIEAQASEKRLVLLSAFLLPLRDMTVQAKKKRTKPLSWHIVRNSLKVKPLISDLIL